MTHTLEVRHGVREQARQLHYQVGGIFLDGFEPLERTLEAALDLFEARGKASQASA